MELALMFDQLLEGAMAALVGWAAESG